MVTIKSFDVYVRLLRLDKPIGIFLVLWPTLWALFLAGQGLPDSKITTVFIVGLILMRSAGCVFNDIADQKFDKHVARTRQRPIAAGEISTQQALVVGLALAGGAFLLVVSFCNLLTVQLSFIGLLLAIIYPLLKRVTHLPQFGLGLAFSWGVPMAYAALLGEVGYRGWLLFACATLWPVIYDTMYAMVDREDDKKIGVKSTAILFAELDRIIIGLLQLLFLCLFFYVGQVFHLRISYYVCLSAVVLLFVYQQWLIKDRNAQQCFAAFLNNNWVGCMIFLGIVSSYWLYQ